MLTINLNQMCWCSILFLFTTSQWGTWLLEGKASKDIQPGLYWKLAWPPIIYTSALKIVPLVAGIYSTGFVKCFDIAVVCSFWISPVICESNKKITILFTVLNAFFKVLTFASDKSLRDLIINMDDSDQVYRFPYIVL